MRIITGKYRGKKLDYPTKGQFRPTQDKVKESIFNILGPEACQGLDVLDLFSGTGSLGIESYSRGANYVVCVDQKDKFLSKNIKLLGESKDDSKIKAVRCNALSFLTTCTESFDIVFMDPPWSDDKLYDKSLKRIFASGIIRSSGKLICLHRKSFLLPLEDSWNQKCYQYGDATVSVLKLNGNKSV